MSIPKSPPIGMALEVVVVPVSDVDRVVRFYGGLGWRLDADIADGKDFRLVQFTPPGSACSVQFGKGVTPAAPGVGGADCISWCPISRRHARELARSRRRCE